MAARRMTRSGTIWEAVQATKKSAAAMMMAEWLVDLQRPPNMTAKPTTSHRMATGMARKNEPVLISFAISFDFNWKIDSFHRFHKATRPTANIAAKTAPQKPM